MGYPIQYTCPRELLPCIEAALAANGYVVVAKTPLDGGDNISLVMRCGAVQVLLAAHPGRHQAAIEVCGPAQARAVQLLESLPFNLVRSSP